MDSCIFALLKVRSSKSDNCKIQTTRDRGFKVAVAYNKRPTVMSSAAIPTLAKKIPIGTMPRGLGLVLVFSCGVSIALISEGWSSIGVRTKMLPEVTVAVADGEFALAVGR